LFLHGVTYAGAFLLLLLNGPLHPRLLKPSVLVPVEKPEDFRSIARPVRNIIYPSGRPYCLSVFNGTGNTDQFALLIGEVLKPLKDENLFTHKILISGRSFEYGLDMALQTMLNTFLPPNAILLTISNDPKKQHKLTGIIKDTGKHRVGILALHIHPKLGFGQEKKISIWLREKSPNFNLAALTAIQLSYNWSADLCLMRAVDNPLNISAAKADLEAFVEKARLPVNTATKVIPGDFYEAIKSEQADLTIIGMPAIYKQMFNLMANIPGSVLFISDSGMKSVTV